jgi:tripartite-type tricarboxylate transporter receptor subunit TctC
MRFISLALTAVLGIILALPASAAADPFPNHALTLVVPYSPGATTDYIARAVARDLGKDLGQPVIVENRAGANGIIGTMHVVQAAPDGYTLLLSTDSGMVLNPLLQKNLPYAPDTDLAPVALLSDLPQVLLVSKHLPVKNLKEFVDYARAHPGKINYGSTGTGGSFHLAAELFGERAGIEMTHVPYKGGSLAVQALLSGEIDALFGVVGSSLPQIHEGNIKAIALAAPERMPVIPDLPTFAESGYPGLDASVRYGIAVPARTPPQVVDTLSRSLAKILADPQFRKTFSDLGYVIPAQTGPSQYRAVIQKDQKQWAELIRARHISLP